MNCLPKNMLFVLFLAFFAIGVNAQGDFITSGSRQYDVIDRLEVLLSKDSFFNFSAIKPMDRKKVTERLENIKALAEEGKIQLSEVDRYNIDVILNENFEWRKNYTDTIEKIKDIFSSKIKYNTPYVGIKSGDFSIYLTPLAAFSTGSDNNLSRKPFLSTRGFYARGSLGKGFGYYSYFRTNQERDPLYVQQYVNKFQGVPGAGFTKTYAEDGYDYFDARGGIMFKAAKGIDIQFAYDKVFIGDGFRSLIISDFAPSYLFAKINVRYWKFNYYTLFAQLCGTHSGGLGANYEYPQKYMALHYLDFQAGKRWNIGFFEDVMFDRKNGFEPNYLNPVIFYRSAEQQLGSPDKVTLGFNIKVNPIKNIQLYSQVIINEYLIDEILKYSKGYFANKQALQLGAKYANAFGIHNLDLQGEVNLIRPFVYSHYDSIGTFSHYNLPLAHPLGANLREFIFLAKYQPTKKLHLLGKLIFTEQGLDSSNGKGFNWGGNIFRSYDDRTQDYGYHIANGFLATTLNASLAVSYEITPNIFIDGTYQIRNYSLQNSPDLNSKIYSLGFRINMEAKTFDF